MDSWRAELEKEKTRLKQAIETEATLHAKNIQEETRRHDAQSAKNWARLYIRRCAQKLLEALIDTHAQIDLPYSAYRSAYYGNRTRKIPVLPQYTRFSECSYRYSVPAQFSIYGIISVAFRYIQSWEKVAFVLSHVTQPWPSMVEALFFYNPYFAQNATYWREFWTPFATMTSLSPLIIDAIVRRDDLKSLQWWQRVKPSPLWSLPYFYSTPSMGTSRGGHTYSLINLPCTNPYSKQFLTYEVALDCKSPRILRWLLENEVIPRIPTKPTQRVWPTNDAFFHKVYSEMMSDCIYVGLDLPRDICLLIGEYAAYTTVAEWSVTYWSQIRPPHHEAYLNEHEAYSLCYT